MPLSTTDIHPHVITPECRLPCLRGIVWGPTLIAVGCKLRDDARPHGTLGWLAEWHQQGKLIEIENVGVKGIAQIDRALKDAGIIPRTQDSHPAAAPQGSPEPGSGLARPETPARSSRKRGPGETRSHARPGQAEIPPVPLTANGSPRDAAPPDNGRLLRLSEVAGMFRVAPKTVTGWAREGRLASVRTPGGHRRYPEADVRALLNSGGIRAPGAPCPEPARNPG